MSRWKMRTVKKRRGRPDSNEDTISASVLATCITHVRAERFHWLKVAGCWGSLLKIPLGRAGWELKSVLKMGQHARGQATWMLTEENKVSAGTRERDKSSEENERSVDTSRKDHTGKAVNGRYSLCFSWQAAFMKPKFFSSFQSSCRIDNLYTLPVTDQ